MEMGLKGSTLVLLTVAVAAMGISGQHPVILNENQTRVDVPFGSSLNLMCSLRTAGYERFRVAWYFNPSGPSFNDSHKLPEKMFNETATTFTGGKIGGENTEKTLMKYTLLHATGNNSGWYFCKVTADIPVLQTIESSGTQVVISQHLVILNENQTRVDVPFGSSLNLMCSLRTAGYERFRVAWYFNPSGPSFSESHKLPEKMFNETATTFTGGKNGGENTEKTLMKYTLLHATGNNSGWYFCKVTADIPVLQTIESSGTQVVIITVSPTDNFD